MPRKVEESSEYMISESGNWNVAARFAEEKIMKPLVKCEIYEDLALFGYESILDQLENFDKIPNDFIKITGLKRLIRELIRLSKNATFAMKNKGTKETLNLIEEKLYKIEKILPLTFEIRFNNINKTKNINLTDNFSKVLEEVLKLKSEINSPLNQNHLIFTDKEEFDPVAFKNRIKDRIINKG
jgi:hypothetical protein